MANVTGVELKGAILRNVAREAHIRTDAFKSYKGLDRDFASHEVVNHMDEYVRGDVHTNTAENFFSILKRGIDGVYHHVSEAHLPRYVAEFDSVTTARPSVSMTASAPRPRYSARRASG